MKKHLLAAVTALYSITGAIAQTGYHIQNYNSNGFVKLNDDSVYVSAGVTNKANMFLVEPGTKNWKYLNASYLPNYGTPVIKDKSNGILLMPGSGTVQVTTDGWQTVTTSTTYLNYVNKSPAGYYGFNKLSTSSYTLQFSSDGLTWNNAQAAGTILAVRNYGNKVYALGYPFDYSSMDGGQTYTTVSTNGNFTGTFVEFYMASADTFIAITDTKLHKSFDGGATWTVTAMPDIIARAAFKSTSEFAVEPIGGVQTFSYTLNGGQTWSVCATPPPATSSGQLTYIGNYLYFFPANRTNDYGATWEQCFPSITYNGYDLCLKGNDAFVALKSGKYTYSSNKGRSFSVMTGSISSGEDIMATYILNSGKWLAGDRKGQVFTSTNKGQTWTQKNSSSIFLNATRFFVSSDEKVIVMSRLGQPVVSVDSGNTFNFVTVGGGNHLQSVKPNGDMLDLTESGGWNVRKFNAAPFSTLATYTTTGTEYITAFHMADDNVGYIFTADNTTKNTKVYRTGNGWSAYTPGTDIAPVAAGAFDYYNKLAKVQTFGTDTIIISGTGNTFYHMSNDGGASWNTVTVPIAAGYVIHRTHFLTSSMFAAILTSTAASGPNGFYINTTGGLGSSIGIQELSAKDFEEELILYPNPGSLGSLVYVKDIKNEMEINILNLNGQMVKTVNTGMNAFTTDDLASGMYIVQVKRKDKPQRTAKLIIQ